MVELNRFERQRYDTAFSGWQDEALLPAVKADRT